MNVIVISDSLITRKGLVEILAKEKFIKDIKDTNNYKNIDSYEHDLIVIELDKDNMHNLKKLQKIKQETDKKVMVLDFYEEKSLFSKCMKIGIDAYILANLNSEDISYAAKKLAIGKKYYDADLIQKYMSSRYKSSIPGLTKREIEILTHIANGKSNLEIANELYITEHTVKKHTSNIFIKLNLKDRMQAVLYANDLGIINL
ncbi:MAG: LuxR C-terminal-related transcriptional regulator [Romboutsia sp.]|uniref:response regulator transcription factor n=1 Tax=Romboutsia sp. TaxID=1965302 RepID=UPI003F31789D